MARNVEIKARITSARLLEPQVRALADQGPFDIAQDDSFFAATQGRLKLREFADGHGELIAYDRVDATGPKVSSYQIAQTGDPTALRAVLQQALGITGRVRKQRRLYLSGRTRLHLDCVEGLGDFLELEVVLAEGEPVEAGEREAAALLAALGIDPAQHLAVAYVDLLAERQERHR
jgi:adenylate cyclase class IV